MERSQWDLIFVPSDTRIIDRPELLYCATPRDVSHLNSVVRDRLSDGQRDAAIEEVVRAHEHVTSQWLVHDWRSDAGVRPALDRHGYKPSAEHQAYAIATDADLVVPGQFTIRRIASLKTLLDGESVFSRAFGIVQEISTEHFEHRLEDCRHLEGRSHRFVVYEGSKPVSGGAMTLFPALGFAMLWRGGTVPEARGRGAYRAVIQERIRFARSRGISLVGLYARLETSAPIVRQLGFIGHGRMTFWERLRNT